VLLAVFFLVTLCFAVLEGTFSIAAADRFGFEGATVGLLWFYMGVVAVVVQGWLVGRLARRVPERALVVAGAASLGLGLALIPLVGRQPGLFLALGMVVAGQGLASPSLSSLISKTVEAPVQGEVLGVSQSLSAGARVIGPAGGGFVLHRLDASSTYVAAAAAALAALALLVLGGRTAGERETDVLRVRRSGQKAV
jgi:predicted MFS family arabinose efflux permease